MRTRERFISDDDKATLTTVGEMTEKIRDHQDAITTIAEQRRVLVRQLRDRRITYREIAEAMGLTQQSVYKTVREPQRRTLVADEQAQPEEVPA